MSVNFRRAAAAAAVAVAAAMPALGGAAYTSTGGDQNQHMAPLHSQRSPAAKAVPARLEDAAVGLAIP